MAKGPFYAEGLYIGKVTRQGLTESATKGTPQFVLTARIMGEPDEEGNLVEFQRNQQYERTVYMVLTDKTMEWVPESLAAIGFEGDTLSELDPSHPKHQSFVGSEVKLWCSHDEYKGQTREKWSISRNRESALAAPVDPKKLKKLDSLFGKAKRASGSGPVTKTKIKANDDRKLEDGTTITDDDLPDNVRGPEVQEGEKFDPDRPF